MGTDAAGNKITLDTGAVKAIAPALMKHGLTAEKAKDVISAFAEHVKAQSAEAVKAEAAFIGDLVNKTRAELGKDLPAFVDDAKKGGSSIFGKELWGQLVAIPSFANDVRVIKALAAYGRSVKTDDGAGNPGGGGEKKKGFTAEGWIEGSNSKS